MSRLSNLLESNFRSKSQEILLEISGKKYSWADIDVISNHVAHKVINTITIRPSVLFINLGFGCYFLSSVVACIKLGRPFIPIHDKVNLNNINADDSILIDESFINSLDLSQSCESLPYEQVADSAPLYGIMTSGTTGEPKIPLLPHTTILNLIETVEANINDSKIWSCIHAVTFGFSTFEYLLPLALRKKIISCHVDQSNNNDLTGPISLAKYVQEGNQVDVACLTPSGLTLFQRWLVDYCSSNYPKYIILSGEPLTESILNAWHESSLSQNSQLINTFATAESGGQLFWQEISFDTPPDHLGLPLQHHQIFLFDENKCLIDGPGTGRLAVVSDSTAISNFSNSSPLPTIFIEKVGLNALLLDDLLTRTSSNEYIYVGRIASKIKYRGEFLDLDQVSRDTSKLLQLDIFSTLEIKTNHGSKIVSFAASNKQNKIQIWPALGEFNEYDAYTYEIMTQEGAISKAFIDKIKLISRGKKILDLGCGGNLIVSKLALGAGAAHISAYEIDNRAYEQAQNTAKKDIQDCNKIDIFRADISALDSLPDADYAITRIFGNIASADGLIPIVKNINSISSTQIKWLPEITKTNISCVDLPIFNPNDYFVTPESESFFKRLERREKNIFRGRLCIRNFDPSIIISTINDFEVLDFNNNSFLLHNTIKLSILKDSSLSGFILWVSTFSNSSEPYDNYLDSQKGWLPVYIPLSSSPINVNADDVVLLRDISSTYDSCSPDYFFVVEVRRNNEIIYLNHVRSLHTCSSESTHYSLLDNLRYTSREYNENSFYNDKLRTAREIYNDLNLSDSLVILDHVPLTRNNKLDKNHLEQIYLNQFNQNNDDSTFFRSYEVQNSKAPNLSLLSSKLKKLIFDVSNLHLEPTDNLFERGLTSLDIVSLSALISEFLCKTITLSMIYDYPSIDKLAKKIFLDYPELNNSSSDSTQKPSSNASTEASLVELNNLDFKIFSSQCKSNSLLSVEPAYPDNNVAFILSPPRSGSTLLRVLLGSVNSILAPPELELLRFDSLQDWCTHFSGKNKLWREGFVEFLMYLFKYNETQALNLINEWNLANISVPDLYLDLISHNPNMFFIEKSTYYSLFPDVLNRIKNQFPKAKILHLVRNPIPCISSYSELRLDTYSPVPVNDLSPEQVGELMWTNSHQNILNTFSSSCNYRLVFYDDIVNSPKLTLNSIIDFLGISSRFNGIFDISKDNSKLMISGTNANTKMLGDPNFFNHSKISKNQDLLRFLSNSYKLSKKTKNLCSKLYESF